MIATYELEIGDYSETLLLYKHDREYRLGHVCFIIVNFLSVQM